MTIAPSLAFADEDGFTTTASGLKYKQTKGGRGSSPKVGDLCAIRFKGTFKGVDFDDILNNPEPYYFRLGSGQLVKVSAINKLMPHEAAHSQKLDSAMLFFSAKCRALRLLEKL